ncbi:MAG: N-acetylglucosamine-6-phosphate deacetylase [Ruminococcaceae bacterium]|nr:N-acetylglucosamine-6-phosphate deacetylase [Oscillospiraceae bacterium]
MITRIKNGIIIADTLEKGKYIYFDDGRITAVTSDDLPYDNEIDAEGNYVSPGFIDIHTHGAGNADFADGDRESIICGCNTHAKHGTTTIFPTCTSSATKDILNFLETVRELIKENAPGKPHIAGSHLEGPYFADGQRGAQNPAYIKAPVPEEYKKFYEVAEGTLSRISFAPELPGSLELCDFLSEKGVVASFGHTDGVYSELKPAIDKGCRLATHLYSGMNCVTRRNLLRNLGAVETTFLEDDVYAEIICDGIHLPPELLKLIIKIKGTDKLCMITDSMRAAGMPEGDYQLGAKDDGLECTVKNGVAYLHDMTAFAGSVATTDRLVRVMYKQVGMSLTECIKMMCAVPAKVMHIDADRGLLKEGYFADIVIFDEDINVKKVIIEGKEYN